MLNVDCLREFSSLVDGDFEKKSPKELVTFFKGLHSRLNESERRLLGAELLRQSYNMKYYQNRSDFAEVFFMLADVFSGSYLDNKGNSGDIELKIGQKLDFAKAVKNSPENMANSLSLCQRTFDENCREALAIVKAPEYVLRCATSAIPSRASVGIIRYVNQDDGTFSTASFNQSHLMHCSNVWLCPECHTYIQAGRCQEIQSAFTQWHDLGGKCYMLTLTAAHSFDTKAVDMVGKLKAAYNSFRHDRSWREMWAACPGPLGTDAVIGNWEFTFGKGGTHPHRHLLLFMMGDPAPFVDRLKSAWVRICGRNGLRSVVEAVDFRECETSGRYLAKIGHEMSNSSYTKEASGERLNFVGLCIAVVMGEKWAQIALSDYIRASKGLRALHWSMGLKAHFNVSEASDDDLLRRGVIVQRLGYISRRSYNNLRDDKDFLLYGVDVCKTSGDKAFLEVCEQLMLDFYAPDGSPICEFGFDTADDRHEINIEARRDQALNDDKLKKLLEVENDRA